MIGALFTFGTEVIEVRVEGNQVLVRTSTFGSQFADIEGIQFSYSGVISEFPDLKDSPDWKEKAIQRFRMKLDTFQSDDEKLKYIIDDLKRYGYICKFIQKQGFRPQRYNG